VTAGDAPALRTRGLVKRYGPRAGVLGVDLAVPRGAVYGLVGPNGAGKTTLLSLVSGLRRADAGEIVLGVDRRRLSVCPDVAEFEPWLTGAEVVSLSGRLAGLPAADVDVLGALGRVGLTDAADQRVGGYSRGMTQRLGLAAALVCRPELVILDEPSSALDPAGRAAVLDLVAGWAGEATVLLSSHVLADVQRVADVVGVIDHGVLVYQGPLAELIDRFVRPEWSIRVRGDAAPLVAALAGEPWVVSVTEGGGGVVRVRGSGLAAGESGLVAAAARVGARVVSVVPEEADLESAYLALTGADEGAA
jgi:ABC-2 type transport system ATP-binding protein